VKRIIIVDDEPATGTLASEYLRLSGFEVTLCQDPEAALKTFSTDGPFDLLILDKRMPGMDGFELLEKLRARPDTKSLPVILLSASVSPTLTAEEAGVSLAIPKPFSPKHLVASVQSLLDHPHKKGT